MAIAIAAAVIVTAVIAYQAAAQSNSALGSYTTVTLPTGTYANFYGTNSTTVNAYVAPNYGRVAAAETLRQDLCDDLDYASAVYCLARAGRSTVRPTSISIDPTLYPNFDARTLGTPNLFQGFLEANLSSAQNVFTSYRGAAANAAPNLSIFILAPSSSISTLVVRAVYELDFVATTSPPGTYVSVRRYDNYSTSNQAPTDYYDIFYPSSSYPAAFAPTVVHFERSARLATAETSYDAYKQAANRPFYFVWWPDPAAVALEGPAATDSVSPRSLYAQMGGRTSFFMVLPMFPAL